MVIILILDAISHHDSCERIDTIQMIIGLTFVMKHTGSKRCDLSNSRKWCHDPFRLEC